jgi:hypothetical protein
MSLKKTELIKCPKCGKEHPFTIWGSVNTQDDPEMRYKVRSGEAFRFDCPECKTGVNVNFDILYHQPEDKLMVHYCTTQEGYDEAYAILTGANKEESQAQKALQDLMAAGTEGYVMRLVPSQNQLREKLTIFDNGLDDRIIEFTKAIVISNLQRNQELQYDEILFLIGTDGSYAFELVNQEGSLGVVPFEKSLYDDCAIKFGATIPALRDDPSVVVDLAWVLQKVAAEAERTGQKVN